MADTRLDTAGPDPMAPGTDTAADATLSTLVTLVRRSSSLLAAILALASFLPAVFVTSRLQGAPFTTPMRLGAFIILAVVLVVRRTLPGHPTEHLERHLA
jgi:hypothetical protein